MHARRALPSSTSYLALKNASTGQKEGNKGPYYRVHHPNDVSLTGLLSKAERWVTVQKCTKVCRVTTADFLCGRNQDLMFPWESFNQTMVEHGCNLAFRPETEGFRVQDLSYKVRADLKTVQVL